MKDNRDKNNIIGVIFIAIGALSLMYFIKCFFTYGIYINFVGFFFIIGALFIGVGFFRIKYKSKLSKILNLPMIRVLHIFMYMLLASFILVEGCIIYNANIKYEDKPDYVVMLGAGIRGKYMLPVQYWRAERGLSFLKQYPDLKVIVSGGKGSGEDISEAEAMREFLVKNGISEERIIKEEKSTSTMENLKNTKAILKKVDGRDNLKIAIVTSNFHVFRAKFLAERCGFKAYGISARVDSLLLPNYCAREYLAIIKSFIFDR